VSRPWKDSRRSVAFIDETTRLRRAVHGNYLIFYRVDPDHVVVVHVLHGARDYDAILFPEG
jgi:toxin ParE1/3/4